MPRLAAHSLHCLGVLSAPGLAGVSHPLGLLHWQDQSASVLILLGLVVQFMFPVSLALEAHLLYSCLDQHSHTPVAVLTHPHLKILLSSIERGLEQNLPATLLLEENLQC